MGKITALEPQQNNPRRVNLYLDGEFALGLDSLVAAWLQVGREISPEELTELQARDAAEVAYQKALHFLSYRPRSTFELRRNLTQRGLPEALVEATLLRLQENGLVDDRQFARAWVENRSTFRPRGRAALRMELRQKGLSDEIVQSVLAEGLDEQALAEQAASKQARRYAGLEWIEFRQKLGAFLARRGFSYSVLAPVVSKVWQELQTADTGIKSDHKEEDQ